MEKVLVISIRCVNDLLTLSAYEEFLNERRTIEHYEDLPISHSDINDNCLELFRHLNSAGRWTKVDKTIISSAKHLGQSLFDRLLTLKVKELLYSTKCQDLILKIDGNLVQIPWELLYDGSNFLCQRFNMGRMVNTKQGIKPFVDRKPQKPFKMLILADPNGDLEASYEEGNVLIEKINNFQKQVKVRLKASFIETEFIRKSLREFDLIHYAGHAKYDLKDPTQGGLQAVDGEFSTNDIISMIGTVPFPFLIFSNACQSGQTEAWSIATDGNRGIYGLANAFLLAGVKHYIGTFWDIPDKQGLYLAVEFYQNLLKGMSIGQSLRKARLHLIQKYGEENITWMAYMLYGDPTCVYFGQDNLLETASGQDLNGHDKRSEKEVVNDPPLPPKLDNGHRVVDLASSGEMRGVVGSITIGKNENESISRKSPLFWFTHHFKVVLSFLVLIMIGIYIIWKPPKPEPFKDKIDIIIEELEKRTKKGKWLIGVGCRPSSEDEWTSRPMTMSVFGYLSMKDINPKDSNLRQCNNKLAKQITTDFHQNQRAIELVNRTYLDEILDEQKISSSDLADRKNDLIRIGKLLGARLLLFSEIIPGEGKPIINIEVIEVETSLEKFASTYPLPNGEDYKPVTTQIVRDLIKEIKSSYPMRGEITRVDDLNQVKVNLGSRIGLRQGLTMAILGRIDEPKQIGRIKVIKVEQDLALAKVLEAKRLVRDGDRVIAESDDVQE